MADQLNIDLLDDENIDDPYPLFRAMRDRDPIMWSARHHAWVITGHAELDEAFKDTRLSTERMQGFRDRLPAERLAALEKAIELLDGWMLFNEAPVHQQLREPVRRRFTPKAVSSLEDDIRSITDELLDEMEREGTVDLVDAFAHRLPANVIGRLFGVPDELRSWLASWSEKFSVVVFGATKHPDYLQLAKESAEEFHGIIGDLMDHYAEHPTDNLISALLARGDDADGLTNSQILGACSILLFAGHDTTASSLGSSTLALLRRPEQFAWLRDQTGPTLPDTATEELLRFEPPAKVMMRNVVEEHERGGHRLEVGQAVFMGIGGANRDPRVFADPENLNLERDPNPHLTFGYGRHFCLGASLARLEVRIALRMLLDRFPDLQLAGDVAWRPTIVDRSPKHIPVRVR
ncbi:MAG: cytochrome P450 [Actinobacteria bacterium]|nr:cytochrome P450 [Actinomycetota bacterium]